MLRNVTGFFGVESGRMLLGENHRIGFKFKGDLEETEGTPVPSARGYKPRAPSERVRTSCPQGVDMDLVSLVNGYGPCAPSEWWGVGGAAGQDRGVGSSSLQSRGVRVSVAHVRPGDQSKIAPRPGLNMKTADSTGLTSLQPGDVVLLAWPWSSPFQRPWSPKAARRGASLPLVHAGLSPAP